MSLNLLNPSPYCYLGLGVTNDKCISYCKSVGEEAPNHLNGYHLLNNDYSCCCIPKERSTIQFKSNNISGAMCEKKCKEKASSDKSLEASGQPIMAGFNPATQEASCFCPNALPKAVVDMMALKQKEYFGIFQEGKKEPKPSQEEQPAATGKKIPKWVWIVIGVGIAFILLLATIFTVLAIR